MGLLSLAKTGGQLTTKTATSAFDSLFNGFIDYKKTVEEQKTRRAISRDARDMYIAKIDAQRRILEKFVDHTFAERRAVLDQMFYMLNQGIERNDIQAMQLALAGINNVITTPALEQVKELMRQCNDDSVKEIEF